MEAGKKSCPYCAEVIMTEAILCKHCQSDLRQKTRTSTGWPRPSEKKFGLSSKIVASIFIAITLYVAFGFYVGNTSKNKERTQAREAAERCREEVDNYSGPEVGKTIVADVCQKLEDELRKSLSPAP
ncbi:hypothetical protein C7534_120130 [Pseudomonas sp. OV226]|nr:hypothetical protein C7534_120130 [Pseudomonas sp. OV226]